jgi:UDP:flavonoid glycosyltransferase YjiC (YdhE family)
MRVLFATTDWSGHYMPMVPLAWALRAAGHEVIVLCSSALQPTVGRSGLASVALAESNGLFSARVGNYLRALAGHEVVSGLPPIHPLTGREMTDLSRFDWPAMRRGVARWRVRRQGVMTELARDWRPDLVVHDLPNVDGRLVADAAGCPAVLHLWGLAGTQETDWSMRVLPEQVDDTFAGFGLRGHGARVTHVIDPSPDSMEPATEAHRLRIRNLSYNGPGALPGWLLLPPARPRVCLVWGTSVTRIFGPGSFFVPRVVDALAGFDVDIVLAMTAAETAKLSRMPPNVHLVEYVPLRLLLPGCALLVHNGGAGCSMAALAAGVPQLVVAVSDEHAVNGTRLAAAGTAEWVRGSTATVDDIAAAAHRVLIGAGHARNAALLADQNRRRPAPTVLVPRLAELAATASRPARSVV